MPNEQEDSWRRDFELWGHDAVERTVGGTNEWDDPRRQFALRWLRDKGKRERAERTTNAAGHAPYAVARSDRDFYRGGQRVRFGDSSPNVVERSQPFCGSSDAAAATHKNFLKGGRIGFCAPRCAIKEPQPPTEGETTGARAIVDTRHRPGPDARGREFKNL